MRAGANALETLVIAAVILDMPAPAIAAPAPNPLKPVMLKLGSPQPIGGGMKRPIPNSSWMLRSYCSSCARLLKNFVAPKRNSLTTLGDKVRVFEIITCLTFVSTFWPLSRDGCYKLSMAGAGCVPLKRRNVWIF